MLKINDVVKCIGPGWTEDLLDALFVIEGVSEVGPYFSDEYNVRRYADLTGYWACEKISHIESFFKEVTLSTHVHPQEIIDIEQKVRSEIRMTLREWPYDQELFNVVQSNKIKFFFAPKNFLSAR